MIGFIFVPAGIGERVADEPAVVPVGEGESAGQEAEHSRWVLRPRGGFLPSVGPGSQR
jgi:hypothetical protein